MAKGDHLKVARCGGLYTHHGIDMGDGTVMHFSGEPLRQRHAKVVRESMDIFTEGVAPRAVTYPADTFDVEAVIERALSFEGQKGYHLWHNNCEHFASYCKTGKKRSGQVRRAAVAVTGVAVACSVLAMQVLRRRRKARRALARASEEG